MPIFMLSGRLWFVGGILYLMWKFLILSDILTFCHPNFGNFFNSSSISSLETYFAQGKKKNL
jgi:hypothetical protein